MLTLVGLILLPGMASAGLIPAWQQKWSTTTIAGTSEPILARELSDGSTMVVGTGVVAIRYDANGSVLSTAVFSPPFFVGPHLTGSFFPPVPIPSSIAIDSDGTIFVASETDPPIYGPGPLWIAAYNGTTGEPLWPFPVVATGPEGLNATPAQILVGADGNPIVIAHEDSNAFFDTFVNKYDRNSGELIWGPVWRSSQFASFGSLDASGDLLLGTTATHGEIVKINGLDGSLEWGPIVVSDGVAENDFIIGLETDSSGNVVAAVQGVSAHQAIVKYSGAGSPIWGPVAVTDSGLLKALTVTPSGDVVLTLRSGDHFSITKYAGSTGSVVWGPVDQPIGSPSSVGMTVRTGQDGSVFVTAWEESPTDARHTWRFAAADGSVVWGPLAFAGASGNNLDSPVLVVRSDAKVFESSAVSPSGSLMAIERDPASGAVVWGPTGFSASLPDLGTVTDVTQDSDGAVFVTGYSGSRWVTLKYDRASGAVLWGPIYYETGSYGIPHNVRTDAAGNAIIVGDQAGMPVTVVKYAAADGAQLWTSHPMNGIPTQLGVDLNGDVGILSSYPGSENDLSIVKISGVDGSTLWGPLLYIRSPGNHIYPGSLAVTPAGDFVISGYVQAASLPAEWVTLKYSGTSGSVLWGPSILDAGLPAGVFVQDVVVGGSGNVIVVGEFPDATGAGRMATIAYDGSTGATLWGPLFVTGTDRYDQGNAAAVDSHGDVFVTGYALHDPYWDFATIKYRGTDGFVLWGPVFFDGPAGRNDIPTSLALDGAGNAVVAGTSEYVKGARDIVVIEYDGSTGAQKGAPATLHGAPNADLPRFNLVALGSSVVVAGTTDTFLTAAYNETDSVYCDPGAPPPTAWIGSDATCAGQLVQLNASNYPGATYAWTGPAGFSSMLRNPTLIATPAAAGTYSVAIQAYGCSLPTATVDLIVHPEISAVITASLFPTATASVPDAGPGAVYYWNLSNGGVISGQGTRSITFGTIGDGPVVLSVQVFNESGCSATGVLPISGFYTVAPCRLIDTRQPDGPLAGPSLIAGQARTFTVAGVCGIPPTARDVALNVTAVRPTDGPGYFTLFGFPPTPPSSTLNYRAGQIRANNAIVRLGPSGDLTIFVGQGTGTADVVVDVTGFIQ